MHIKPLGKLVILLLVAGMAVGGWRLWQRYGGEIAPASKTKESVVPSKVTLPGLPSDQGSPQAASSNAPAAPIAAVPGSEPGCTDKPEVRYMLWAWNAQMGLVYATGGAQAAKGSLMCQNGVNLKLIRQDDTSKMQEALVAFATALKKSGGNPTEGVHFVNIMGDGSATFLKGLNDTLRRLGPEYQAKVVCTFGYSRGEDKFMGPPDWKQNPQAAKGGVVAGVLRDGDWNIAQKWLGDNGIKNNPDEKTWDPDALNWVNANTYIEASEKYVAGYTETRPVVRNGKRTGETKEITIQGVVTWTPGDVIVAQKKGGLVSIVSTREYSTQMPCTVIGIDKWMRDNRPIVEGLIAAALEGGQQIRTSPDAFKRAAALSAAIYQEQGADASYWAKYFSVVKEKDSQGLEVELGGSSVNNVADALLAFGMAQGSANLFAATYTVFGDVVKAQYPELMPTYQPADQIVDSSYLKNVAAKAGSSKAAEVPKPAPVVVQTHAPKQQAAQPRLTHVVSRKAWNIQFATGSSTFTPQAMGQLNKLRQDLLVAQGANIEIHGHTDNVGSPQDNMNLSEARAFAVKTWLEKSAPLNFQGRIRVFAEGQTNPVAPNGTEEGRAKNRRVEIVIGTR